MDCNSETEKLAGIKNLKVLIKMVTLDCEVSTMLVNQLLFQESREAYLDIIDVLTMPIVFFSIDLFRFIKIIIFPL